MSNYGLKSVLEKIMNFRIKIIRDKLDKLNSLNPIFDFIPRASTITPMRGWK